MSCFGVLINGRDLSADVANLRLDDGPRANSPVVPNSTVTAADKRGSQRVGRSTSRQVSDGRNNAENGKPGVWTPGINPPDL